MNFSAIAAEFRSSGTAQSGIRNLPYFRDLRPASWRGIPFGVARTRHAFGRKNVVHQYPYVDGVYVEDMGQSAKKYYIQGFFVEGGGAYGSGTLKEQIERMDKAVSQPGDAVLVHPLLGSLSKIALIDYECETGLERGRVAILTFAFISNSARKTPSVVLDTPAQTVTAASAANVSHLQDFAAKVYNIASATVVIVQSTVNQFSRNAQAIAFTSTSLVKMVSALPGQLGRMVGQNFPFYKKNPAATIQTLIGLASAAQASVLDSTTTLKTSAAAANAGGIGTGVQAVVAALLVANPDPGQAIQSMLALIAASPSSSLNTTANAVTDLIRRSACAGLGQASSSYQPISYQDAQNTRLLICAAIQTEMDIAGDQGLDASYNSLRDLKLAVSQDMTQRGASLANMIVVSSPQPLSSLVWAQKLYQDSSREPELVNEGDPIHPSFMPTRFNALAS